MSSSSSHWKLTCSRHDIAEKLLSWHSTAITHYNKTYLDKTKIDWEFIVYFNRDIDETKDWIDEKDCALNNDNYGHDLASVQALQRKHDALERDLSALGEKVCRVKNDFKLYISAIG